MEEIQFPTITKELVDALTLAYPDRLPDLKQGERIDSHGLGFLYGCREVVQKIQAEYEEQQEELRQQSQNKEN